MNDLPEHLLTRAQAGDRTALLDLLELYRNYLKLIARAQIGEVLRVCLDSSDLVQETFLEASQKFAQFAGTTEPELLAWLRNILVTNSIDQLEHHSSPKRGQVREASLDVLLERSATIAHRALAAGISGTGTPLTHHEQAVLFADAVANLPDDYREVITLRHMERLKFEEIAERMGRSSGAVRRLWLRALEKLRDGLEKNDVR